MSSVFTYFSSISHDAIFYICYFRGVNRPNETILSTKISDSCFLSLDFETKRADALFLAASFPSVVLRCRHNDSLGTRSCSTRCNRFGSSPSASSRRTTTVTPDTSTPSLYLQTAHSRHQAARTVSLCSGISTMASTCIHLRQATWSMHLCSRLSDTGPAQPLLARSRSSTSRASEYCIHRYMIPKS